MLDITSRLSNFSGLRKPVPGELKPISIEQSSTRDGDIDQYGAHRAVDSNLETKSCTDYGDGKWLQAKFDGVHCIRNVMWYYNSDIPVTTWTCDENGCDCEGSYCDWAYLSLGDEGSHRDDCGDNIKITFSETFMVAFSELAITEIKGKKLPLSVSRSLSL